MVPFGELYSKQYDVLYSDKDYASECVYLEALFRGFSKVSVSSILELGAGTGNYSLNLAGRGYKVHATDISPAMLKVARAKARAKGMTRNPSFEVSDMSLLSPKKEFDACLCMFAAINYLPSLDAIGATLGAVRKGLRRGGLFIFDSWNGKALEKLGPTQRFKVVRNGDRILIRLSSPSQSLGARTVSVAYTIFEIERGRLTHEFNEIHNLRYLYPHEIREALESSGFELLSLHPFLQPQKRLTDVDWNATAVARKR